MPKEKRNFLTGNELYNKYKKYMIEDDDDLIQDSIALLEDKIQDVKCPYAWVRLTSFDYHEKRSVENIKRYKNYTRKIRNRLVSLGYQLKEVLETYSEIEGEWVLYMSIKDSSEDFIHFNRTEQFDNYFYNKT